jgi:hypothetical protein
MEADIPYRVLGQTGERVSAIGLGGWHLALNHVDTWSKRASASWA